MDLNLLFGESAETTLAITAVLLALVSSFMALAILGRDKRTQSKDGERYERLNALLGRLERLDRTINEFKTETTRSLEILKARGSGGSSSGGGGASGGGELPAATSSPNETDETTKKESLHAASEDGAAPSKTLTEGLAKTRSGIWGKLREIFSRKPKIDASMVDDIEAQLVSSDLGIKTVTALLDTVRGELTEGREITEEQFSHACKAKIREILGESSGAILPVRRGEEPLVVMMVGVNGVGKTTTTAKLAAQWSAQGAKVLMVAADTFRAAAVAQLIEWGKKISVPVVSGAPEAKPQTVVYDAVKKAKEEGFDVILIDTAGRLHTKSNLMQELEGVRSTLQKSFSTAPHETLLVLDGSTGSNALFQAKEFHQSVPLTGIVVTKLDGTPKGGVVVSIRSELGIPVRYIGIGESEKDLREFVVADFVDALFDSAPEKELASPSAHAETRRRRRRGDDERVVN